MSIITESIFNGKTAVIALANVQHFEKHWYQGDDRNDKYRGIQVITCHTKWNTEVDCWENPIYLVYDEAQTFIAAWGRYRNKLEQIK